MTVLAALVLLVLPTHTYAESLTFPIICKIYKSTTIYVNIYFWRSKIKLALITPSLLHKITNDFKDRFRLVFVLISYPPSQIKLLNADLMYFFLLTDSYEFIHFIF